MKKAFIWAMAAMMLMGSIKAFASDSMMNGKMDAAMADQSDIDFMEENSRGTADTQMMQEGVRTVQRKLSTLENIFRIKGENSKAMGEDSVGANSLTGLSQDHDMKMMVFMEDLQQAISGNNLDALSILNRKLDREIQIQSQGM